MKKIAKSRVTQLLLALVVFSVALSVSSTKSQAQLIGRTTTCSTTGSNTFITDVPFFNFFAAPVTPIQPIGAGAGALTLDRIFTVSFPSPTVGQMVFGGASGAFTNPGCGTDGCISTATFGTLPGMNRWVDLAITRNAFIADGTCDGNIRMTVQEIAFFPYFQTGVGCVDTNRVMNLVAGTATCPVGTCTTMPGNCARTARPSDGAACIVATGSAGATLEIGIVQGSGCGTPTQFCGGIGHYRIRFQCTAEAAGACAGACPP